MAHNFADFLRAVALALAALLPLINPLGSAPIFLSMTPGATEPTRTALARRIAATSFLLLLAATLVGSHVLQFFGLSLAVIKIAGGLLVIQAGWQLISADDGPRAGDSKIVAAAPAWSAAEIESRSFYPLTFPLTVGPGSVSVAITLGAGTRAHATGHLVSVFGTIVGIALAAAAVYFCYRSASGLVRALGHTGSAVLLRLSAFILLAIGVQILCTGLAEQFPALTR